MIIIIVDLGHFKAYKVVRNALESTKIEPLKSYDNVDAHGKFSDKVTDGSGRFALNGGKQGRKGPVRRITQRLRKKEGLLN